MTEAGQTNWKIKGYSGIYSCHKYWGKKPLELYELILDEFTAKDSIVCDPFVGSGVLPSVCKARQISFTGCDLNPVAIDIAKMFIEPPTKEEVEEVLESIKSYCQKEIDLSYTLSDGTVVSHIVWQQEEIDEVWTKVKRSTHLIALTEQVRKELRQIEKPNLRFFKDRSLHKNNRINVVQGQKVSDLFTPRALKNIDFLLGGISQLKEKHRTIARFILSSSLGQMSRMVFTIANRRTSSQIESQKKYEVGSWVIGYWRPKTYFEINVWHVFEGRAKKMISSLSKESKSTCRPQKSVSISLKCEDALDYLKNLKTESIHLLVTDPPHSDRIPYLELSEMWNTVLDYQSDLEKEFIYSNAPGRNKSLSNYLEKFQDVLKECGRVLMEGGVFILIFNTTNTKVWSSIKMFIENNKAGLKYQGRFSAEYSAGSVVQDNREGALVNDWCLVISKGEPLLKYSNKNLPGWSKGLV